MAAAQSVSARGVIVLALVTAALAALLYYKPGKKTPPDFSVSSLAPRDVSRVEVSRPDKKTVVLEKRNGEWHMSEPFSARADAAQIETLLSVLDAKSTVRYQESDLARFDLDRPVVTLVANGQKLLFGAINPITGEQYVASEGQVYLVPARFGSSAQNESWASRKLLADDEQPERFRFPSFAVAKSDGQWSLDPPASDLTQEDFRIWVNRWQLASALATEPANEEGKIAFTIVTAGGKEIPLSYSESDTEFFFVRGDEKLKYRFSPSVAKPLVAPPQSAAAK